MDIEEARDILSVESDASEEKIDERYRELVQKNHPDKGGSSNLFKQIEEAYELLTQVSEEGPEDDSVKNKQEYFKKHELNDKFELGNTSKSDIKEIVEKSFSTNVTENLITGKKSEAANINKIVSRPVLNYLYRNEQIHFVFSWNKIQFGDDVLNPNNGGIALFTNNRVGIIADLEKKGIEHSIFHEEIQSISSPGGGKKSEFSLRLKLRNKKMIIGLDNRNMDYLSLSDYHEMDREVEAVRSLIDQASVIF